MALCRNHRGVKWPGLRQSMRVFMNKCGRALACIAIALTVQQSWAAEKPSDNEIRRELVGSWIVPLDSSDRTPQNIRALEIYRPDGTSTFYVFQDSACRVITNQAEVKWTIDNGVLTSLQANGEKSRDEVISIGNGKMTLHSLDDGSTYTRVKARACSRTEI
jgi:hypothetical protein